MILYTQISMHADEGGGTWQCKQSQSGKKWKILSDLGQKFPLGHHTSIVCEWGFDIYTRTTINIDRSRQTDKNRW